MQTKINNNSSLSFKHIFAICCIVGVQVASVLSAGNIGATGVIYPTGVTTVYPAGTVTQCPATSPLACGSNCYSSNQYVCIDAAAGIMCPVTAPNRCGSACYSTSQYVCTIGGQLCAIDDLSCRGIAGTGVISTSKPIGGTVYHGAAVYDQPQYAAGYTSGVVYPANAGAVYPAGYTNGAVVYPANAGTVYPATATYVNPTANGVVYPAAAAGGVIYQQPDTYVTQTAVYPAGTSTKPNVYYTNGNGAAVAGTAVAGTAVYPTTVVGGQTVYPAGVGATTVYPANYATTVYPTGSKAY